MKKIFSKTTIVCVVVLLISMSVGCGNNDDNTSNLEYDEASMEAAISFGVGRLKGISGVIGMKPDPERKGLAVVIYNASTRFDADNGGPGEHKSSENNREKFYFALRKAVDRAPDFEFDPTMEVNFADIFESTFGKLPNHDTDDLPDVVDPDDDGDGVEDFEDDDDDNDGCLDRDEADKNIGGDGKDTPLTGEGRGGEKAPNDPGEKVERDDPNFDPPLGSTSDSDDG